MTKISWKKTVGLYFTDIELGQCFRIKSREAVYMKVQFGHRELKLELATGKIFEPTASEIELIPVEICIDTTKPSIY